MIHFRIKLDESTFPGNEALLSAKLRFVTDQKIKGDLLFTRTLTTGTKG